MIRTLVAMLIGLAALLPTTDATALESLTTSGCETATPTGTVLVQPVSGSGAPERGLRLVDPGNGDEIGWIDVPPVTAVFSTALAGRAIAVAGGGLYLIDARELTATRIALGGESAIDLSPNPVQFRGSAGTRYQLFGSPSFDRTFLIDVEMGTAVNLGTLIVPRSSEVPNVIPFAAVTPNDAHVMMWDGQHVYVVRTDVPEGARQIDDGEFAFAPDFSPNGTEVVYSQSDGPGSGSTVMLESFDGERSAEITESEHALVTLWVPGGRTILVDERTETGAAAGSAYLLDLDSGIETTLLGYSGSLSTVQFDPLGKSALLGTEQMGNTSWHLADLATGDIDELAQLAGSRISPGLYADTRFALATPSGSDVDPLNGPLYRSVDLETGAVGRLLAQPEETRFTQPPIHAQSARLSLVVGESEDGQTLWLLDAVELTATEIGIGSTLSAHFSPDGCGIVSTYERAVDGVQSAVSAIVPFNGGEPVTIDGARALNWIAGGFPVG